MLLLSNRVYVEATCQFILSMYRNSYGPPAVVVSALSSVLNHETSLVTTRQNVADQSSFYINHDERNFVTIEATDIGFFACFDFLTLSVDTRNHSGITSQLYLVDYI